MSEKDHFYKLEISTNDSIETQITTTETKVIQEHPPSGINVTPHNNNENLNSTSDRTSSCILSVYCDCRSDSGVNSDSSGDSCNCVSKNKTTCDGASSLEIQNSGCAQDRRTVHVEALPESNFPNASHNDTISDPSSAIVQTCIEFESAKMTTVTPQIPSVVYPPKDVPDGPSKGLSNKLSMERSPSPTSIALTQYTTATATAPVDLLDELESQISRDGILPPLRPKSQVSTEGSEREVKVQSRYANFLESTSAKALIRSASMEETVKRLSEGAYLWKIRGLGKFYNRQYKIDKDSMSLVAESKKWWSPGGLTASLASEGVETAVPVIDICEIREGWKTDTFNKISDYCQKMKEKGTPTNFDPEIEEDLCFSVVHGKSEVLDLMANSKEEQHIWVNGLKFLMESVQSLHQDRVYDVWLRHKFESADKDGNGALTYEEVCSLITSLNLKLDKKRARNLFNDANTSKRKRDGEQVLDSQEFVAFYHSLLKMTEIENLYNNYSNKETKVMGANELLEFFRKEQGLEHYQLNQITSFIQEFELSNLKENDNLSFDGFYHLLLSDVFNIYNTDHVTNVFQDMTQPLSHYYISSSHNTYLKGHQLAGESSVEGYISALKKGCKVVELDVWNGDDGEPIIYHGHTLTTKITFADVLRDAIKIYAFVTSPFPLILSVENHLSIEQQVVMVRLLKEILGDMLLTDPVPSDLKVLPSPEDLKNKVIIKAKKPQGVEVEDDDEQDEADPESIDFIDSDDSNATAKKEKHHKPMAPELAQVVNVCEGKKFVSFGSSFESDKCVNFPSLRENKAKSLLETSADEFVKFTKRQIAKIYPLGTRTDSSNLKPYPFWSVGAQVVTLNMQTEDKATFYNEAFFRRNNNCGYVLKPDLLVSKTSFNFTDPPPELSKVLRVRVISGQHLPASEKKNDIVDPYIQLKVRGHPRDKQKHKTRVIKNNGFNPVWNEELVASIRVADVALVYFTVRDESSYAKDPVLAITAIPFTSLSTGYRHVHLTDNTGKSLAPAALFVHVTISDN